MKGTEMYELSGRAEGVDWSDVAMAGRAYADNIVGEPAVTAAMHSMADEIERLRLTDAEREAVAAAIGWIESPSAEDEAMPDDYLPITDALRGLLKRTAL